MAKQYQYCIVREDTGHIVYTGDYWDCEEHLRIFIEDDYDHYSIELKEDLEDFEV